MFFVDKLNSKEQNKGIKMCDVHKKEEKNMSEERIYKETAREFDS